MLCCGPSTSASPGRVFTTGGPLSLPHTVYRSPPQPHGAMHPYSSCASSLSQDCYCMPKRALQNYRCMLWHATRMLDSQTRPWQLARRLATASRVHCWAAGSTGHGSSTASAVQRPLCCGRRSTRTPSATCRQADTSLVLHLSAHPICGPIGEKKSTTQVPISKTYQRARSPSLYVRMDVLMLLLHS